MPLGDIERYDLEQELIETINRIVAKYGVTAFDVGDTEIVRDIVDIVCEAGD